MQMKVDNYILEKSIGEGAFGEVFITKVAGDDKTIYATKKLDRPTIDQSEAKKYLENEIKILRYLNHPNIVKYKDLKKSKNHYFVIMEYCNGGELKKALQKYIEKYDQPFPEEIVQHLMRQIISAFKYIHEKNIIHRDVKPDNILLHYENEEDKKNLNLMKAQVKIIDFGFSCFLGPDGLRYTTLGSPLCMDPLLLKKLTSSSNKVRQLGYNQSADIWSIGTVCYEMLIGKPAFDAEDMTDLINKVENGSYKIPTTMSYEIVSFLNGMLQYSAKQRLTAAQLYRHDFLNKDVKQFKKINLEAISDRVSSGMIDVNAIHNTTIWSIFNAKSETLLSTILGAAFVKPVDKNEEQKLKIIEENTLLRLPTNGGIPENVEKNVTGMTKEELDKLDNAPQVKESNYVFSASIFDS
jgi:serine/threonine protein kinase